jgi:hypothetical protein
MELKHAPSLYESASVEIKSGQAFDRTLITESGGETTDNDQAVASLSLHDFPLP